MADRPLFLYAAIYDNHTDAEADYVGVRIFTPPGWSVPTTPP